MAWPAAREVRLESSRARCSHWPKVRPVSLRNSRLRVRSLTASRAAARVSVQRSPGCWRRWRQSAARVASTGQGRCRPAVGEPCSSSSISCRIERARPSAGRSAGRGRAARMSSRRSGETAISWQRVGNSARAWGSTNRVRTSTRPSRCRSCSSPAGTQTPRPGGTTQRPWAVLTMTMPQRAWISCAWRWRWGGTRSPWA